MTGALTLQFTPAPPSSDLEDAQLVVLSKRGSGDAFDELVRRHAPKAHAVASRIVGREEAFDVVQEAFISAYRALKSFREEAQFTTWLHRIVLNACYAKLRKNPDASNDVDLPLDARDAQPSPVDIAERRDLRSALERALQQIKAEFRETFALVEFGELDYAAVAEVLGIEVGTVKSRMNRARAALREILEEWGYRP
ncbi:MAG: sigma-70 family RNA polymerase sigma factor [Pleurocapsa sp. SU_196_0]|nr:sigma-70 family RNA polymerase sigma factor [Pleurocapsa sp. SU_196_0]